MGLQLRSWAGREVGWKLWLGMAELVRVGWGLVLVLVELTELFLCLLTHSLTHSLAHSIKIYLSPESLFPLASHSHSLTLSPLPYPKLAWALETAGNSCLTHLDLRSNLVHGDDDTFQRCVAGFFHVERLWLSRKNCLTVLWELVVFTCSLTHKGSIYLNLCVSMQ